MPDIADSIILWCALAGIAGARVFFLLEHWSEFIDDFAGMLFSTSGFSWYGGFLGVILALWLLSRRRRLSPLVILDLCAPAASLGFAIGRLGCLVSGDGDVGSDTSLPWGMMFRPLHPGPHIGSGWWQAGVDLGAQISFPHPVHPTPIYESAGALLIFWYLWRLGARAVRGPRPVGEITAEYLLWSGIARFLVEFVRRDEQVLGRFTTAQIMAFLSAVAGAILLVVVKRAFKGQKQEHRILQHATEKGDVLQPEYHQPTPECPEPQRWTMYDSMTAELEVLEFLTSLVTTLKPALVVETGTFMGVSTLRIAEGLKRNGRGTVVTIEYDAKLFAAAQQRFAKSGLADWIEARNASSLETKIDGTIDLLFSDSEITIREQEVRHFLPQMSPTGIILMHDASSHLKTVREAALRLEAEGLISTVLLPTPRGLVMAQKREGRR